MVQKKSSIIGLAGLLIVLAGSVSAAVQAVSTWQQANSSGFGDAQVIEVSAIEPFNGYLYAGTDNPIDPEPLFDGAEILRSADGVTWTAVTQPGFGNAHDTAPPAIEDFAAFNGYLYAGTGRGNASQLWRSQNGTIWDPVDVTGFADPDNVAVNVLIPYNGMLYAGVTNQVSGAQIWRSFTGDNNSWTQAAPTTALNSSGGVTGMAEFDGGLYAAIESEDVPAQIWRSFGGDWTAVMTDGFGDSDNATTTGGMAAFGTYLYVGAGNAANGAELWRSSNGTTWEEATPAFGDANNEKVEMVFVFQNQLYIGVTNTSSGIEIWRTADGSTWEQANTDGFGDTNNTSTNGSNAATEFMGRLYAGTSNTFDGGELWRMLEDYAVYLSPVLAQEGSAGQDVVFNLTVSNIGQNADSIDLAASGQIWTTVLSISQVDLDASASADFTVTVSIPPGAADQESDTVTITATSQSDNSKTDAVVLTTTTVASMVCGTTTDTPYKLGDLSVTITDQGTDLDCVRVSKTRSNHPGAVTSMQIGQYWSIEGLTNDQTTTATPDFVFNLTLPHNVTPDTVANVCKYLGGAGASAWDCDRTGSDASTVWRNGITGGFSDWAASNGVPTALTLNSFSVSNHPSDSIFATILVAASALLTLAWRFKRSKRRIDTVSDD